MTGFRSFDNSTRAREFWILLEAVYLRLREIVVKTVTIIKCGLNDGFEWQW